MELTKFNEDIKTEEAEAAVEEAEQERKQVYGITFEQGRNVVCPDAD